MQALFKLLAAVIASAVEMVAAVVIAAGSSLDQKALLHSGAT
jgi:hypothetical protein